MSSTPPSTAPTNGIKHEPQTASHNLLTQASQHSNNLPSTTSDVYNWSHVYQLAIQQQVMRPVSESDIVDTVRNLSDNQYIRVIGSGLSFEQIHSVLQSEGDNRDNAILLDLRCYSGLINYDHDTHTVTYKAGTKLESIFLELQESYNRILPCSPGVIAIQTLAGAISTGTHGQGLYQSSLADVVTQLRICQPGGIIKTIKRGDSNFGAYISSLGCFGVILDITLETRESTVFTCNKVTYTFNDMIQQFSQQNESHEFVKGWWFPDDDIVHVWEVDESNESDANQWLSSDRNDTITLSEINTDMNKLVEKTKDKMSHDTKADRNGSATQYKTVDRFKNVSNVCGSIYQILCKGIPVPQINCEIAVPYDRMNDCLLALNRWYKSSGAQLHYPFILRCAGASTAWLSPAYNKRVCWIGSLVYLADDGTAVQGGMDWLKAIQQVMIQYDGLPHLGKHYRSELYSFDTLLPRWNDFIQLKQTIDPLNQFSNNFILQLFSLEKQQYIEPDSLTPSTLQRQLSYSQVEKNINTAAVTVQS